jgi:hypothetical protein
MWQPPAERPFRPYRGLYPPTPAEADAAGIARLREQSRIVASAPTELTDDEYRQIFGP